MATTNYALPTYTSTDAPDLTSQYNAAMAKIDTQMKANATAAADASTSAASAQATANTANTTANANKSGISAMGTRMDAVESTVATLQGGSFAPQATDPTITVEQLSALRVTNAGIVYVAS